MMQLKHILDLNKIDDEFFKEHFFDVFNMSNVDNLIYPLELSKKIDFSPREINLKLAHLSIETDILDHCVVPSIDGELKPELAQNGFCLPELKKIREMYPNSKIDCISAYKITQHYINKYTGRF